MTARQDDGAALAAGVLDGRRRAVARGLTVVERGGEPAAALMAAVFPASGRAAVAGLTGPPGVGKSSLVAALSGARRAAGRRVAILAVDPSSPFTQGALLGDRIRLGEADADPGVLFRSLATRGELGGLSRAVPEAIALLDAAGFDDVLVETTGVGQSEVEIAGHADVTVLVLMPGAGDETQLIKAGIMEVPDLIVVNRADQEGTREFAATVRRVVRRGGAGAPVLLTSATEGSGIEELAAAIDARRAELEAGGELAARRRAAARRMVVAQALAATAAELESRLSGEPAAAALLEQVGARRLAPAAAARQLLA